MFSPIFYPGFKAYSLVNYCTNSLCSTMCPVFNWLAFGKLAENPIITPTANTQVVFPSGVNKFLQSVTVKPIPTTTGA